MHAALRALTRGEADRPMWFRLHRPEGLWSIAHNSWCETLQGTKRKPFLGQKPSLIKINQALYANTALRGHTGFYLSHYQQIPTIALTF